jgi:uncharacterized glyoxalase superfamily protein PhnB
MPSSGIQRLLGVPASSIVSAPGTLQGEVYLLVDDPEAYHQRALEAGAQELSPLSRRDWGHAVAYSVDADGYILAFASPLPDTA